MYSGSEISRLLLGSAVLVASVLGGSFLFSQISAITTADTQSLACLESQFRRERRLRWKPAFSDADLYWETTVTADSAVLAGATYLARPNGPELIHYANAERPEGRWRLDEHKTQSIQIEYTGDLSFKVAVLSSGRESVLQISWYNVGGRATDKRVVAKLWSVAQLLLPRKDASYLSLLTPCGVDCVSAAKSVSVFLESAPWLQDPVIGCTEVETEYEYGESP